MLAVRAGVLCTVMLAAVCARAANDDLFPETPYPPRGTIDSYRGEPGWHRQAAHLGVRCDQGAPFDPAHKRSDVLDGALQALIAARVIAAGERADHSSQKLAALLKQLGLQAVALGRPPTAAEDPGRYNVIVEDKLCLVSLPGGPPFNGYSLLFIVEYGVRVLDPPGVKSFAASTRLEMLHATDQVSSSQIAQAAKSLAKVHAYNRNLLAKWLRPHLRGAGGR